MALPLFFNRMLLWLQQWHHQIVTSPFRYTLFFTSFFVFYAALPEPLFESPYATVVFDENNRLLGAKIAQDGQWRFPAADSVPFKFKICLLQYEDRYFYSHPGLNPWSMTKAIYHNVKGGKNRRGGSTISQQLIRLSRQGKARTYIEKGIETLLAVRLECRYSKEQILNLYAAHAPFGGNVVGLEMASWRYYGIAPHQLSWAESALLAVLPNAPRKIYPGKNQQSLLTKRNQLLMRLFQAGKIDHLTCKLAVQEPLPQKPFPLPNIAPHFVALLAKKSPGKRIKTTLQLNVQDRVNQLVDMYHAQFMQNEVHNAGVVVIDVKKHSVIGYVGNTQTDAAHCKAVDMIQAARSTGSILKPFLLASLLEKGELLPHSLVPDIPVQISGFVPQNYDPHFDGAVPADRALARSLNIPAVLELQQFGVHPFYARLKNDFKMTTLNQHPDHYGLSLILGGAECTLWDLARIYSGWAQTLQCYESLKKYPKSPYAPLIWTDLQSKLKTQTTNQKPILSAGALFATLQAMQEVNRPEGDEAWRYFDSSLPISWKTGTSFGNRDAWAVGVTANYVVAVWVGNASGEGRPELTGVGYAAPLLFDVFRSLPRSKPFVTPDDDLELVRVCLQSGYLAKPICPQKTERVPKKGSQSAVCPYHKWVHLDASKQWRVNSSCASPSDMLNQSWFVLPPVMAYYFQNNHADYRSLPPWHADCTQDENHFFDFIYPKTNGKIYLTRNQEGRYQAFVCKVACAEPKSTLYWYLDRKFIGQTNDFHELPIQSATGIHRLIVVHENGQEIHRTIEIIRD